MKLEVRGLAGESRIREYVVAELTAILDHLGLSPTGAQVSFADENGPKGGVAVRCLVEVRAPRRPPVDVQHVAESRRLAADGALSKLGRLLGRDRARRRARSRRPKKYYAAKRALAGEGQAKTA